MAKKVDVSILVLNYNGKKILPVIINSVKKMKFTGTYELIMVDNASTDGSQELLKKKYPWVKLVQNKQNLGTSGVNSGLKHCNGTYIAFFNNDNELFKDTIQLLYDTLESRPEVGAAVPQTINYFDKKIISGGYWISHTMYAGHFLAKGTVKQRYIPYGGIFLFRKELLKKIHYLFDPDYFIYSEDLDFSLRVQRVGYKMLFVPTAKVYHMHAYTMSNTKNYKITFYIERNLLSTLLKIFSVPRLLYLLPIALAFRVIAMVKDLLKGEFKQAGYRLLAIGYVVIHLPNIVKKRWRLHKHNNAQDSDILKLFSEKYLLKPQPRL